MPITIKLPTPLRRHTNQTKLVEVEAATVGDALARLVELYPAMQDALFADGQLKSFMRVYAGAQEIGQLQGLDTPLQSGDTISILPPVAGA